MICPVCGENKCRIIKKAFDQGFFTRCFACRDRGKDFKTRPEVYKDYVSKFLPDRDFLKSPSNNVYNVLIDLLFESQEKMVEMFNEMRFPDEKGK